MTATMPPMQALEPIRLPEPVPTSAPRLAVALLSQDVSVAHVVQHVQKVREIVKAIFKPGVHYGVIPGTEKKCPRCGKFRTLDYNRTDAVVCVKRDVETEQEKKDNGCGATFDPDDPRIKVKKSMRKEGGEALCLAFHLMPEYVVLREHLEPNPPHHLELVVQCLLRHMGTGAILGMAIATASTRETKWGLIQGQRKCPDCDQPTIRRSGFKRADGGEPGWYCNEKAGGCKAEFDFADVRITNQAAGKAWREEMADVHNTIWAMACKRAMARAVVQVTACGDAFEPEEDDAREPGADDDQDDRADRRQPPPAAAPPRGKPNGPKAGAPMGKADTGAAPPKRDAKAEKEAAATARFGAEALAEAFKAEDWFQYLAREGPEAERERATWETLAVEQPQVLRTITDQATEARGRANAENTNGWTVRELRALKALGQFNPDALKGQTQKQAAAPPATSTPATSNEGEKRDTPPPAAAPAADAPALSKEDRDTYREAIKGEWKRIGCADATEGMRLIQDLGIRVTSLVMLSDAQLVQALKYLQGLGKKGGG